MCTRSHLEWRWWGYRQGARTGACRLYPGQASAALLRRGIQGKATIGRAGSLGAWGLAAAGGARAWLRAGRAVGKHILLPDV